MVIEIKKSNNEKYRDTLRMSKMLPFEYAILSKVDFKDPLTGESQYGTWAKYNVILHEYKTTDLNTGEAKVDKPEVELGWFASGVSLEPKLPQIEVGQKFRITQVQVEGKAYSMYKVELVNEDGSLEEVFAPKGGETTTSSKPDAQQAKTEAPAMTLDDKIKMLKTSGLLNDATIDALAKEYDTTIDFINKRKEVL